MTPRDRLLAALRGQPVDRVPLVLDVCHARNREDLENIKDPRRRDIAERIYDHTHFFVNTPSFINRSLCIPPANIKTIRKDLPNGKRLTEGQIQTSKGPLSFITEWDPLSATEWTRKYPCETLDDIAKIRSVSWAPDPRLKPPDGDRPAEFSKRGIMTTHISSPVVCVAGMMPYELFLELCATDFELVADLTQICLERILKTLEILLSEEGIEYVWMGGSEWLTPPMGSPRLYDLLVQEQESRIIHYVHSHSRAIVHVHCHGRVRHALQRTIERGADYTEPVEPPPDGDITMAEAKALAAGHITLGGNIECRILCYSERTEVEAAVCAAFEGGKERFILTTTAGPSPRMSEREYDNYRLLLDLWEEMSPLP